MVTRIPSERISSGSTRTSVPHFYLAADGRVLVDDVILQAPLEEAVWGGPANPPVQAVLLGRARRGLLPFLIPLNNRRSTFANGPAVPAIDCHHQGVNAPFG